MNVGQVQFSVKGDGLDATLAKAKELNTILNSIDKRTVGAKTGAVTKASKDAAKATQDMADATKNATKEQQKADKLEERRYHNAEKEIKRLTKEYEKAEKEDAKTYHKMSEGRIKEANRTAKRTQKVEAETRKNGHKLMESWVSEATQGFKTEQKNLHKQYKELEKYNNEKDKQYKTEQKAAEKAQKEAEKAQKEADRTEQARYNNGQKQFNIRTKALKKQEEEQHRIEEEAANAPSEWQHKWEQRLVNAGAQMQTLGSALQRVSAPFANIMRGFTMGIGYRMLYKVMDSFQGMFSRYDTMKTYGIVLEELGMDASKKFSIGTDKARTAVDNLEQAVLGLPTGLDEIVASMRVYAGATGDVEKATKLAIAANNAFIAGGMDSRQQLFTQRQLLSLAGGAELSSNQWDSLRRNAPLAIRAVAKEMGKGVQEMVDGLKNGTIAGQEFLDVFVKVGTEGKLANAAQRMKVTFNALGQNIQNAMNRAGEGILKTLDSVFKEMNGRTLLQNLLGTDKNGKYIGGGIRGAIDDIAQSAQKWIKANPEKITNFFKDISSIDWKGIISSFARFGFMMGRFYAWLGKISGGGKLVSFMLWTNLIGKVIQNMGGLLKGSAGFTTFLARLIKFGKLKKASETLTDLATAGDIKKGAENVADAALSWQQVANKGLNIASILVVAKSVEIMSRAMKNFSSGTNGWGLAGLTAASGALAVLTSFITNLGKVIGASKEGMIGAAVGTGVFYGISKGIEAIGNSIGRIGEGLEAGVDAVAKITTTKLPTPEKVAKVTETIVQLTKAFSKHKDPFHNFAESIDAWTKGLKANSIIKISKAMDSIKHLGTIKIKKSELERAKTNFQEIQNFAVDLVGLFSGEDEKARKKTSDKYGAYTPRDVGMNGRAKGSNTYPEWQNKIRGFAEQIKGLADSLGYVDGILTTIDKLNKHYVKFGKMKDGTQLKFNWDYVYNRITRVANFVAKLAAPDENGVQSPLMKLKEAASHLKGEDYTKISEAMNQIPKVIRAFDKIQNAITNSGLFGGEFATPTSLDWNAPFSSMLGIQGSNPTAGINFANRLRPIFDALKELATMIPDPQDFHGLKSVELALGRIKTLVGKLGEISNMDTSGIHTDKIKSVVDKITEALNQFDSLKEKEIDLNIDIEGNVTDNASGKIDDAYKDINDALEKIKGLSGTKEVKVHVNAVVTGVTAAVQKINEAIAKIRDAINRLGAAKAGAYASSTRNPDNPGGHPIHTGGKVQYRALGGEIFKTKGTDTVPAMLTPGEWVVNRKASSLIGDNVLWKLNHMDIKGAISSLSTRFGSSNVVNNTYNRNIGGITLNNNNTAGVGLNRANRWVKGL